VNTIHRFNLVATIVASAFLVGCADMTKQISGVTDGLAELTAKPTVPQEVKDYEAWTIRETHVLDGLTRNVLTPMGRTWEYRPMKVTYEYQATPNAKKMSRADYSPPARFVMDLPIDAVAAHHAAVGELIKELAELTIERSAFEPSFFVVVGRTQADRQWLRNQAELSLAQAKTPQRILVRELEGTVPRVGFVSNVETPQTRTVQASNAIQPTRIQ
jgi:hypothetical protein